MLVSKICLTGGPCAGKTTALSKIEKELTDLGYKVFIIDEVATRLINAGIKPFGNDSISMLEFEDIVLKEQLTQEECYEKVAKLLDKKCVIICDRGIFDIKSFIGQKEFEYLLRKYNLSKIKYMDNYDLVIHMNTAAKGAEEFYTNENNKARSEDITEAIKRDDRCQESWSFHSNFKIIDNNTDFETKVQKVIDTIKDYFKIETKWQKKYLINITDDTLNNIRNKEIVNVEIKQTYLKTNSDYEMRLRKRMLDNDSTYFVTVKKNNGYNQKIITEEKIDKKTYERLLIQKEVINEINKKRISFIYNDKIYKLDIFENGMCILETDNNSIVPPFINVIEDVTLNEDYFNINIEGDKHYAYQKRR